jgi:predicted nucleic acid-binding protein
VTSAHVVLDTGVLGLVTHPSKKSEPRDCKEWLKTLLQQGVSVYIPEIADYELRRELLRLDLGSAVARLDSLKSVIGYLPITTAAMIKAAEFWASARKSGVPTADPKALDADVILAAQTFWLASLMTSPVVATTNVDHLGRFVDARRWQDIS